MMMIGWLKQKDRMRYLGILHGRRSQALRVGGPSLSRVARVVCKHETCAVSSLVVLMHVSLLLSSLLCEVQLPRQHVQIEGHLKVSLRGDATLLPMSCPVMRYRLRVNSTGCQVWYASTEFLRECAASKVVEVQSHRARLNEQGFLCDM